MVASVLATAVLMLSPFAVAPARTPFEWTPFLSYYRYTSGQTFSHVFELALAFFPIGFAVARIAAGAGRWMATAATALLLASVLEYLQGWIVGRVPDVTDVAMLLLGALAGAWVGGPGWHAFVAEAPNGQ